MQHKSLLIFTIALFGIGLSGVQAQTVMDFDGNVYPTITIGNQIWMAENLKTTRLNDGTSIPLVSNDNSWSTLNTPAYCWLNNDISNKDEYGALYNWYTVSTKKLCPKGWHVPSDSEWTAMITFLGNPDFAGDKLKETGMTHWKSTISTATNEFGFTALPGGMRVNSGIFPDFANSYGVWWTTTEHGSTDAWNRGLFFSSRIVYKGHENKRSGFSVRCIRD